MDVHAPAIVDSAKCALAAEILRESGSLRFCANGSSMLPSIYPGDILTVHRREFREMKQGEIAFFFCYDRVAAHRVVSKGAAHLVTQGDSHLSADPPITADDLLGVVVSIERGGKAFAPALRPSLPARWTAAVLRRSDFAVRVWLRVYLLFIPRSLKIISPSLTVVR